jgi:hypothetical protein
MMNETLLEIALERLRELQPSGSLASPKSICRKGTRYVHFRNTKSRAISDPAMLW